MRTVYEVTQECEYTGTISTLYRGGNKAEALRVKRDNPGTTYRSYYAGDQ